MPEPVRRALQVLAHDAHGSVFNNCYSNDAQVNAQQLMALLGI